MTVAAVVQVAILTGEEGVAEDLVNDNVRNLFEHIQEKWDDSDTEVSELRKWLDARLGLQYSPKIWKVLKNAALGKALQVDTKALEAFVDEGCDMIKERFTQGPARPYADHSFAELVQILDESYIAARKANPTAGEHMSVLALDNWPNEPTSFLRPPATEGQITELEARLSRDSAPDDDTKSPMLPDKHLPEDYKDFLRTSNGFETDANDQCGIFYGVEYVGTTDVLFFHDMDFTLFPYEYTSVSGTDNVSLGKFRCFSIGAGGDEGEVILIPPSSVKPVLEAFEVVYAKASEQNKRMYDRAAVDLYGGLEALRNLEWLCIVWYHWNPDQEVWGSFRKCLEECVSYAVERRRTDERDARAAELEKEKGNGGNEAGEKRKRNAKTDQKAQTAEASDVDMGDSGDGAKTYDLRERKSRRTD
ncbi:hypothetical protein BKA66DRAFT_453234 [Pyrenochaeta sp. MPI-SDFR-AT-0127]|nr:hypothetical protein BKA66DRAFT_453234 [Pyrenochaeta sp. MPI-SDFR-AT-0127]